MKLFQQLMLAPAVLAWLPPGAMAGELNFGVSKYAHGEQVTSISQFSDVYPTDWAYQFGQPDRALRLRRWLSQRHLRWQPRSVPLRSSRSAERLPRSRD